MLFDDIEHGIQTWLTIYLNSVVGMYSVFGPIGFRNSAGHSDVSDASANGLSDLVPFYTIGFIIILALLLTWGTHSWTPSISSCMDLCQCCGLPGSHRALQNHQRSRSVRHQRSNLSQLLSMTLCALVFQSASFVRAGETQTEPTACSNPHQVASVAMAVTDSCEEGGEDSGAASGGFRLPEHCSADCAAVFLPWFGEGRGTCFTALDLDEMAEQTFTAFASVCETENSAVDMSGAIFIRPSDSTNSTLICFDASCEAAPILDQRGAIVVEGCEAGAPLGSVCRLGCSAGFEISAAEDGHCSLSEVGALAVYTGHSVICSPETEQNGQMSESYCRMAATEAMLDCCELENVEGVVCAADIHVPPTTCVVECAEIWEPLVEDCEQHLQDFQQLTSECAEVADSFLARAPSSLTVAGLQCLTDANGVYQVADTVGGKPHWVLNDTFG
eukprot:SAG22_NODE_546_length_9261_cov_18.423925_1_plen_444_part_10